MFYRSICICIFFVFGFTSGNLIACASGFYSADLTTNISKDKTFSSACIQEEINSLDLQGFLTIVEDVLAHVPKMAQPRGVHLTLRANDFEIHYKPGFVTLPLQYEKLDGSLLSKEDTKVLIIHEVGHMVLDSYLTAAFPPYKTYRERRKDAAKIRQQLDSEYLSIQEQVTLKEALKKLLSEASDEEKHLYDILHPFDELFADAFVAAFYGNPKVVSELPLVEDLSLRDFTVSVPVEGWNKMNPYHVFSPIKSQLWTELTSGEQSLNIKKLYSNLLLVISDTFIEAYNVFKSKGLSPTDIEALNQMLSDSIEAHD